METSSSPLYGPTAKHRSQLQIWAEAICCMDCWGKGDDIIMLSPYVKPSFYIILQTFQEYYFWIAHSFSVCISYYFPYFYWLALLRTFRYFLPMGHITSFHQYFTRITYYWNQHGFLLKNWCCNMAPHFYPYAPVPLELQSLHVLILSFFTLFRTAE